MYFLECLAWIGVLALVAYVVGRILLAIVGDAMTGLGRFARRAFYILTTPTQWVEGLLTFGLLVGGLTLVAGVTKLFMMASWMF